MAMLIYDKCGNSCYSLDKRETKRLKEVVELAPKYEFLKRKSTYISADELSKRIAATSRR
jgi:hypothetical protein